LSLRLWYVDYISNALALKHRPYGTQRLLVVGCLPTFCNERMLTSGLENGSYVRSVL
jgi:hypothetical protein